MGNHRVRARYRAPIMPTRMPPSQRPRDSSSPGALNLRNWPVSTRLIAVIVLALLMGLVFGGLRVASAADSADEFGRVSQLAVLGQQVTGLVQALENERDETSRARCPSPTPETCSSAYSATRRRGGQGQDAGRRDRRFLPGQHPDPGGHRGLRHHEPPRSCATTAQSSQSALAVIAGYAGPITDMIALNDQIAQGTSDSVLVNDVQTLNSLSLAKDQAAQQRALLFNAFNQQIFADGEQQALITAQSEQLTDLTAFNTTATPAETERVQQHRGRAAVRTRPRTSRSTSRAPAAAWTSARAPWASARRRRPRRGTRPSRARSTTCSRSSWAWPGTSSRGPSRCRAAPKGDALFTAILTAVILLLVLLATVAVARSLVGPLRRLREGALNIATVELPERVRLLGEAQEPSDQPGGGADRRAVHRRDRPGRPGVRPGPLGGGTAGGQRGDAAQQLQRDVRQPVPAQPVADRAAGAHDRLPRAERGRSRAAVQPVRDGPPGHPNAPQLGEPAPAGRARERAQVERAGVAGGRGPGRGLGDRAVQPGDAEDPAGHRGHRAGGIRRRAPAGRGDRERHDLLRQGHPGARGRRRS